MAISRIVLECPHCSQIFETESPDKIHTEYLLKEPVEGFSQSKIVKKKIRCQNPECKKINVIYWYEPMDYFNRM